MFPVRNVEIHSRWPKRQARKNHQEGVSPEPRAHFLSHLPTVRRLLFLPLVARDIVHHQRLPAGRRQDLGCLRFRKISARQDQSRQPCWELGWHCAYQPAGGWKDRGYCAHPVLREIPKVLVSLPSSFYPCGWRGRMSEETQAHRWAHTGRRNSWRNSSWEIGCALWAPARGFTSSGSSTQWTMMRTMTTSRTRRGSEAARTYSHQHFGATRSLAKRFKSALRA